MMSSDPAAVGGEGARERGFVVGRITRPHGIHGALRVQPETDHPEHVFRAGHALGVRKAGPGAAATLTVREARPHGRQWLVEVEELEDRTHAEQYAGALLTVPRGALKELEEGEYFLHDLVGLEVTTADGTVVGEVGRVYDPPGAPILGVKVDGRERLVPFHRALVRSVDLAAGRLVVELPEGLLDI